MAEQLHLKYVPISQVVLWDRNPKQHDLQLIAESIARHGFVDPPKFDPALNSGEGGLVYGNGRETALIWMYQQRRPAPRGVVVDPATGEWHIPIIYGVDADNEAEAEALAVAHNNLTMHGGTFTNLDISRMYDQAAYAAVLEQLAVEEIFPVGLSGSDLDSLLEYLKQPMTIIPVEDEEPEGFGEGGGASDSHECRCPHCGHVFDPKKAML